MYSMFAKKLTQLRHDKSWTQAHAAKMIGIQQSYLSKLENGKYLPSEQVIEKLCRVYNVRTSELSANLPTQSSPQVLWLWCQLASMIIAVALFSGGYLGLLSNNTYYTYKSVLVEDKLSNGFTTRYHLSDHYRGEQYSDVMLGAEYHHQLIAEKTIYSVLNRILMWLGGCLFIATCGFGIVLKYRR